MDMNPDTLRAHNALHGQTLLQEWQQRRALIAESDKRMAERNRLRAEADRLQAEADRLRAESDRLRAKSGRMYTEGYRLWLQAIREHFGDVPSRWDGKACIVAGERYEP